MIAIFGDEDVGEQRRPRASLLNRQRRHGHLHDRLAGALHRPAACASTRLTAACAMTLEGDGAEGASSSFTGTKAGAPHSGGTTTTGVRRLAPPIAPPLPRAPYPLENEIGVQPVPTRDRRDMRGNGHFAIDGKLLVQMVETRFAPVVCCAQYPARLPCLRRGFVAQLNPGFVTWKVVPLPTHTPVGRRVQPPPVAATR